MNENAAAPDPRLRLMADWITIWQSEAAALSTDREMQESWQRLSDSLAQQATALLRLISHDPPGCTGTQPAPGASPAGIPPDAPSTPHNRDAIIAELLDRVAALERERP